MKWFALAALWLIIAAVAVAAAVVGLVRGRLKARHRVDPRVRTDVPYWWQLSPAPPARLHRRLARATAVARDGRERSRPPKKRLRRRSPSPLDHLVDQLSAEAVAIDGHLVLVSRLDRTERARLLGGLDGQVRQVEHLAGRVAMLGVEAAAPPERTDGPSAVDEIEAQVGLLEQSRRELDALDRANGLTTTARLPRAVPPVEVSARPGARR